MKEELKGERRLEYSMDGIDEVTRNCFKQKFF